LKQGFAIPTAVREVDRAKPVVYFKVREVALSKGIKRQQVSDYSLNTVWNGTTGSAAAIENLDSVTIRYFFYYPADTGVGGHHHDVESADVVVDIVSLKRDAKQEGPKWSVARIIEHCRIRARRRLVHERIETWRPG
jgi:hypothetical protein